MGKFKFGDSPMKVVMWGATSFRGGVIYDTKDINLPLSILKEMPGIQWIDPITEDSKIPEEPKIPDEKPVESKEIKYTREQLEKMPMGELRKIGDKYKVKDNKRSDLVSKILEKQG